MNNRVRAIGAMSAIGLTAWLLPGAAVAAPSEVSANCWLPAGSVTAGGDHRSRTVASTVPPTVPYSQITADVYPDGLARLSGSMTSREDGYGGVDYSGFVVLGDAMYQGGYHIGTNGEMERNWLGRLGGGWGSFVAFEEAEYQGPTEAAVSRMNTYGLRNDGVLFRWTVDSKGVWRNRVSYPGFAAMKSMVLIAKARTYDTFLANTRGGALYTIHIPTTSSMKPVVKLVRGSTWQGFEAMLASWCGRNGTLLLGIDKDTQTGYLYTVGHANGPTTVIRGLGKVPVPLSDQVYFRFKDWGSPLIGE